jgi:predicted CXXCH cytochrome family protein
VTVREAGASPPASLVRGPTSERRPRRLAEQGETTVVNHRIVAGVVVGLSLCLPVRASAQTSLAGSKHDLSTPGTPEPCAFCHTPHSDTDGPIAPLWNRMPVTGVTFQMYQSSSMTNPCPATPGSASMACLSCHDGVLANNDKHDLVNAPGPGGVPDMTSQPNCRRCHGTMYGDPPAFRIGTDLRNSHPISMAYPTAGPSTRYQTPPDANSGWSSTNGLRLYSGKVECPSCHNVHNPTVRPFLRKANGSDSLCLTCHIQ